MARKLTDDQEAEIGRRYDAGESSPVLASQFGVSNKTVLRIARSRGVVTRTHAEARVHRAITNRLPDEQEVEIVRRYRAGETPKDLKAAYGMGVPRILDVLNRHRVVRRSRSEANRVASAVNNPGPARLLALYYSADQPSKKDIADSLGVHRASVHRWLVAAGAKIRSRAEQQKIEVAKGRALAPVLRCTPAQRSENSRRVAEAIPREARARWLDAAHAPEARAKAAAALRRQVVRPCLWCGVPVSRALGEATRRPRVSCSRSHASAFTSRERFHPTTPRPLILQQITEAIAQHRSAGGEVHRTLPAKFGEPLGATDAEYDAWWSALDLTSLNDYEMTAYLDWDLDRKIREAGLQSGVSEG